MSAAAELDLSSLDKDPRLFLYTSLTAGSSHIVSATSRMETILKANRIPFLAVDLATDEKCRRLWQRRGGAKKKLPGLVKEGYILGDLEEVEEWNEFGELKENIGPVPPSSSAAPGAHVGVSTAPPLSANVTAAQGDKPKVPQTGFDKTNAIALPGAEEMAAIHKAKKANEAAAVTHIPTSTKSVASSETSANKTTSIEKEGPNTAEEPTKDDPQAANTTQDSKEDGPTSIETSQDLGKEDPMAAGASLESNKDEGASSQEPKVDDTAQDGEKDDGFSSETKKDDDATNEGVAGLQIKEDEAPSKTTEVDGDSVDKRTQEQSAKDPAAAGESVAD